MQDRYDADLHYQAPGALGWTEQPFECLYDACSPLVLETGVSAQLQGQKHIPRLSGQKSDYLVTQLKNLRSGARVDMYGNMASAAKALTDEQIQAFVAFAQLMN